MQASKPTREGVEGVLQKLQEVVLQYPYQIITSLCCVIDDATDLQACYNPDDLAFVIVAYFHNVSKMDSLLNILLEAEVAQTSDESTLFRRNCLVTKVITNYARRVGTTYLGDTLRPIIEEVNGLDLSDFEVDKNRMKTASEEDLVRNAKNLLDLTKQVFDSILASEANCPSGIRMMCRELNAVVKKKFPNSQYSCVGGFIFLRFFCPSMVTPEEFGLAKKGSVSGQNRRILVLVSKILQNISNNVTTTSKEPFMQLMNNFVEEASPRLNKFFAKLCAPCKASVRPNADDYALQQENYLLLGKLSEYMKGLIHKLGAVLIAGQAGKTKPALLHKSEKMGYLMKYGENVFTTAGVKDNWRKRWFVLKNSQLLYFRSAQDSHAAGVIPLKDAAVTVVEDDTATFSIETSYRAYILKASSKTEMSQWMRAVTTDARPDNDDLFLTLSPVRNASKAIDGMAPATRMGGRSSQRPASPSSPRVGSNSPRLPGSPSARLPPSVKSSTLGNSGDNPTWVKSCAKDAREPGKRFSMMPEKRLPAPSTVAPPPPTAAPSPPGNGPQRGNQRGRGFVSNRGGGAGRGMSPSRGAPPPNVRGGCVRTSPSGTRKDNPKRGAKISAKAMTWRGGDVQAILEEKSSAWAPSKPSNGTLRRKPMSRPDSRDQRGATISEGAVAPTIAAKRSKVESPAGDIEGELEKRENTCITWARGWYVIKGQTMYQLRSKTDPIPVSIITCRGCAVKKVDDGSICLTVGNKELFFKPTTQSLDLWYDQLVIASDDSASLASVMSGPLFMQNVVDGATRWDKKHVDLVGETLFVYGRGFGGDQVLQCALEAAEFTVRHSDISCTFELYSDTDTVVTFQALEEESMKAWMTAMKKAKLSYWKKQQKSAPEVPTPEKKEPSGPPAGVKLARECTRGYLWAVEREKRLRQYLVLRDQILWLYKNEKSPSPVGSISTEGTVLRFNENDSDDMQFEVVANSIIMQFEAANALELCRWVRSFNLARLPHQQAPEAKTVDNEGYMQCKDKSGKKGQFWFKLSNSSLEYFEDESCSTQIDSLSIGYCVVHSLANDSDDSHCFQVTASQKSILLLASSKEEMKAWMDNIKVAKLQFWQSGAISNMGVFESRGYLMKRGRHNIAWRRRWFVLKDCRCLLYFKSKKDPTPIGEILLEESFVRKSESPESELRFEIQCQHRTFFFEACSETEVKMWTQALKHAKLQCWKDRGHGATPAPEMEDLFEDSIRNPDREGFMLKQGASFKTWKRRWFVLKYPYLYYFTSAQISSPGEHVGRINLQDAKVVASTVNNQNKLVFQIQLVTRYRVYFVRADSEEDMNQWVACMEQKRAEYNATVASDDAPMEKKRAASKRDSLSLPYRTGFLVKKGRTNKVWKRRYFVLRRSILAYYKAKEDAEPAGVIALENCSVSIVDESIRRTHCFIISTRYRNYFLQAPDQYDMACWIESIKFQAQNPDDDLAVSAPVKLFNKLNLILAAHDRAVS